MIDDISHSNKWTRVPSDLSSVEPILCVPDLHIPMPSNFSFATIITFIWKRAPQLSNRMTPVESGTVVGIFAEGKTHALAVGVQLCIVQHHQNMKFFIRLSCVNRPRDSSPDLLKYAPSGWQDKYVNNRDRSEKQRRWRWELPLPQWWPLEHETLQTVAVIATQSQHFSLRVFFFFKMSTKVVAKGDALNCEDVRKQLTQATFQRQSVSASTVDSETNCS